MTKTVEEETWAVLRLKSRGWSPVIRDRVTGHVNIDGRRVPVVDGLDLVGWTHPKLEFVWPEADALRLEAEHDQKIPQVSYLLGSMGSPERNCPGS